MRGGDGKVEQEDDEPPVEKRQLSCNETCEREKRNQRLAEAFGTRTSSLPPTAFPEELMDAAKVNTLKFIQEIEKAFENLINTPKYVLLTQQQAIPLLLTLTPIYLSERKHSFKPMKKPQRQMVHELALHYGLDAQSFDPEPQRNVVVTKKLTSRMYVLTLDISFWFILTHSPPPPPPKTHNNTDHMCCSPRP